MKSLSNYINETGKSFVEDYNEMLLSLLQTYKNKGEDPDSSDLIEMTQEFVNKHFNDDNYFEK